MRHIQASTKCLLCWLLSRPHFTACTFAMLSTWPLTYRQRPRDSVAWPRLFPAVLLGALMHCLVLTRKRLQESAMWSVRCHAPIRTMFDSHQHHPIFCSLAPSSFWSVQGQGSGCLLEVHWVHHSSHGRHVRQLLYQRGHGHPGT